MGLLDTLQLDPPKSRPLPGSAKPAAAAKRAAGAGPAAGATPGGGPQGSSGPATPVLPEVAPLPAAQMLDEELAAQIMDGHSALLDRWDDALEVFDKTMTSAADAEATPDYQKAVLGHLVDKVMGVAIKQVPGASEIEAVMKVLEGEYKRAAAARASGTLRDFYILQKREIGRLQQLVLAQRQGFVSAVRAKREATERQPRKPVKKGEVQRTPLDAAYAAMHIGLMETADSIQRVLSVVTDKSIFQVLSENWIRSRTVAGGMGTRFPAVVVIRLKPDYSVQDAHLQGSGGQKLAEQLLKDAPDGVDVFRLKATRRILLLADNGWPKITLTLDADNKDISSGSYAEGDTESLRRYVMSKGSLKTKSISGD